MAQHRRGGAFYSTDDLIKMAQLGNFGNYSPVILRALARLKGLENEVRELRNAISYYESANAKDETQVIESDPEGTVIEDLNDLY